MSSLSLYIDQLSFSYAQKQILKKICLKIQAGEIVTLIGSSGSGKSTFFKLLIGLIQPDAGTIILNGHPVPHGHQSIGYMMQEDLLLPWRTVLANLTLVSELGPHPCSAKDLQEKSLVLLKEVGLEGYELFYPHELSGGMRQRVALARTLLQNKPILLLDEPFGALDAGLREHLYQLLRRIRSKYGTTILMVTHDFRDAIALSDRLFYLSKGVIEKEWTLSSQQKEDFHYLGQLQKEFQTLFIHSL